MTNKPGFIALQQAARWYAEFQDVPAAQTCPDDFQRWLNESAENQEAWQHVQRISQRFTPLRETDARKTAALTALTAKSGHAGRRQVLKMAAWMAIGSLAGWSTWRYPPLRNQMLAWRADYRSPYGEITRFTLSDGSQIWLDTDSALTVDYSPTQRRLHLINGRVMIETASDPQRPLTVTTTQGSLHALGTVFSVQLINDSTALHVYQGAVAVSPSAIRNVIRVEAGRGITFRDASSGPVTALSQPEPAWPRGLLQADNLPLVEFIARLSAYHHGYLACDPAVEALAVTGTFPLNDTDMALAMLTRVLPVRVQRRFSWWLTVVPRGE